MTFGRVSQLAKLSQTVPWRRRLFDLERGTLADGMHFDLRAGFGFSQRDDHLVEGELGRLSWPSQGP